MAIGAVGGYGEAALHEALAVNALRVVLDDVFLLASIAHGRLVAGAVAPST